MRINKSILLFLCAIVGGLMPLAAQEITLKTKNTKKEDSKAWEFGLGASALQFSRAQFSNFSDLKDKGYVFDLKLKHVVYGGNLYIARELNRYFYLDVQGTIGSTKDLIEGKEKAKMVYMIGPGLQWRLSEYFGSKHIDPFLRTGINYMHKEFNMNYMGIEGLDNEQMSWILSNDLNKDGKDKKHLTPISVGGGVNMWLNDRWGIGIQADYLIMPYNKIANSLQGTARIIFRLGGKSKKTQPRVEYIEREKLVERIIEKPVEVEKVIERVEYTKLHELFNNIYFDFNKAVLTKKSEKVIDEIAEILKQNTLNKYLITGYTDSKGSDEYNLDLSKRRAATVVNALVNHGVLSSALRSVGVGKKISHMKSDSSDSLREGDRKVTIELINNEEYWNNLSEK